MRVDIEIKGVRELQRDLKDFSDRRIRASTATALTRTAVQVRDKVQQQMPSVFDRPTRYTVRALRYVGATANRLVAAVGFNIAAISDERGNVMRYQDLGPGETPAGKYLQFQVDGGQRQAKRFEKALRAVGVLPSGWIAVPGERAKLDGFGNQSIGEIRQILSWFDAAELVMGSRQNMRSEGRDKRRKGTRRTAGFEYFAVQPGGFRSFARSSSSGRSTRHKMQPGIYRRTNLAMGSRLEPVVIFVKGASYGKRFDFYGMAEAEIGRVLPMEMDKAVRESVDRLLAKGAV